MAKRQKALHSWDIKERKGSWTWNTCTPLRAFRIWAWFCSLFVGKSAREVVRSRLIWIGGLSLQVSLKGVYPQMKSSSLKFCRLEIIWSYSEMSYILHALLSVVWLGLSLSSQVGIQGEANAVVYRHDSCIPQAVVLWEESILSITWELIRTIESTLDLLGARPRDLWCNTLRAWQLTPVLLPGESLGTEEPGRGVHGVMKSWSWLKWLSNSSGQVTQIQTQGWELLLEVNLSTWMERSPTLGTLALPLPTVAKIKLPNLSSDYV